MQEIKTFHRPEKFREMNACTIIPCPSINLLRRVSLRDSQLIFANIISEF